MSNKKKRNKRRHRMPDSWLGEQFFDQNRDDECCILCELFGKAAGQDASWSLSDRADLLVAEMRAAQTWGGAFTPLIRSPARMVTEFAGDWFKVREPLFDERPEEFRQAVDVAVLALGRFWLGYHPEQPL